MKQERIEELARLVNRRPWDDLADVERGKALRIARTLYAAAMRDAAGVAREYPLDNIPKPDHGTWTARGAISAGFNIATALETIAKETDSGHG
jgi:hypothetical protein